MEEPLLQENAASMYILGDIYRKKHQTAKAVQAYRRALLLNPLLWSAYTALCELGMCFAL